MFCVFHKQREKLFDGGRNNLFGLFNSAGFFLPTHTRETVEGWRNVENIFLRRSVGATENTEKKL